MLSWTLIAGLIAALFIAWFWHDSLKHRERANAAAEEACERANLQFLDGTVAFSSIKLFRAADGRLALRRTYVFDYTARSIERQQGFVILVGDRIETVGFAHAAHGEPQAGRERLVRNVSAQPPPPTGSRSNVLDLEQWRKQRQRRTPTDQARRSDSGDGRG
jgi:hypothetical protein